MLEKEIELIRGIATPAVQETLSAYTQYVIVDGVIGIVLGLFLFGLFGWLFSMWKSKKIEDEIASGFCLAGIILVLILSVVCISSGVQELSAPKAAAISKILKDIRG